MSAEKRLPVIDEGGGACPVDSAVQYLADENGMVASVMERDDLAVQPGDALLEHRRACHLEIVLNPFELVGLPPGLEAEMPAHLDVGDKGETREIIRELVGMVTGSGYAARTKPDSFGASKVADRHSK